MLRGATCIRGPSSASSARLSRAALPSSICALSLASRLLTAGFCAGLAPLEGRGAACGALAWPPGSLLRRFVRRNSFCLSVMSTMPYLP